MAALLLMTMRTRALSAIALALLIAGCASASQRRAAPRESGAETANGGEHAARRRDTTPARDAQPPGPVAAVRPPPVAPPPTLRDDDGALTAKIDRATPPRRAAALRLTEDARALLARDEAARAIELLERAVAVDARTPYAYYFLAEAHERLRRPDRARPFLARAEQLFAGDAYWIGRVHALHGRVAEEEGHPDEARDAYARALAAWPRNGDAATGLARLDPAGQGAR